MKKSIIFAFSLTMLFNIGCNNADNSDQTTTVDSPTTNGTVQPDEPPQTEENPCDVKMELPGVCQGTCTGETCQREIAKQHKIEYAAFRKGIETFSHRPSSKINIQKVRDVLSNHVCTEWRIKLEGDHVNKKNTNEDITIEAVEEHGAKVFYELAILKGLLYLGAQEIYFYKGLNPKVGANCYDIFIEVRYAADSFVYYDLSDSEEAISAHK
jgi:hypothetical protein